MPAERPITVRDLLTFTMGFGQLMADAGRRTRCWPRPHERKIGMGPPDPVGDAGAGRVAAAARRAAADVAAGRAVGVQHAGRTCSACWSRGRPGRRWAAFLAERVFGPLGMTDTGFSVPAGSLDRFVTSYRTDPETGALSVYDPVDGAWSRPPAFESGGGGLVSTVDDMLAFGRMLLSGGGPLLSRATVAAMTTDQLTPAQKEVVAWVPWHGAGWGFGVGVATERIGTDANPGRFGWDGGLGTSFSCDPGEDLVGMLLTQAMWTSPAGHNVVSRLLDRDVRGPHLSRRHPPRPGPRAGRPAARRARRSRWWSPRRPRSTRPARAGTRRARRPAPARPRRPAAPRPARTARRRCRRWPATGCRSG